MNVHWHLPSGVEPDSKPPPPALNSPAPDVHAGLQYPAQASRAFIASPVDVEYPFFLHFFFTFFSFHFFIFLKYFLHGFDFFLSTQSGSFSQASAEELGVGPLEGVDVLSASEGLGVGPDVGAPVGFGVGAGDGLGLAGVGLAVSSASEGPGVGPIVGAPVGFSVFGPGVGVPVGLCVGPGVGAQSDTPQLPQSSQPHSAPTAKFSRLRSVHQPRSWSKAEES